MSEVPHDDVYYAQLARVARLKANSSDDADLARRLRETAVRYERKARQLKRTVTQPLAMLRKANAEGQSQDSASPSQQ